MKKLTFTLWLIAITLTTACSGHKKAVANSTGNDSISAKTDSVQPYVEEEDTTDYSKFANPPTRIDTTVGDWEIHVREFYDGKKINYPERYMSYTSLKVNIYKAGKPVFKNYKLDIKSLAGLDINNRFTLSAPEEVFVTQTTVYLSLSYCDEILALDRTYTLAFCANGQTRKVEITNESYEGEYNGYIFDLYNFYAMYVNELAQPRPNPAEQILHKRVRTKDAKPYNQEQSAAWFGHVPVPMATFFRRTQQDSQNQCVLNTLSNTWRKEGV